MRFFNFTTYGPADMDAKDSIEKFSRSYQPLDRQKQQIRLPKVEHATRGPIRCGTDVFDLDTAP